MKILPDEGKIIIECQVCAKKREILNRGRVPKTCSATCRKRLSRGQIVPAETVDKNRASRKYKAGLEWDRLLEDAGVTSTPSTAEPPAPQVRLINALFRSGEYSKMIDEVQSHATVRDDGCWDWPYLTDSGYAKDKLYRKVIEARIGKPLGSQAAHHKCANAACVNPEHLQPVTHYDNSAEMFARHSYIKRIRDLEMALMQISPEHPLLGVAEVK